ncbi:MAG TPA: universal stress protein [Phycisphaerae bacterium]|nr:universal stress protein [Phycisphaerae bacterium]
MKTLLVCIDFSDKNEKIFTQAKKIAASFKEQIILLHVCQPNPDFLGYEAGTGFYIDQMDDVYKAEAESLKKMAAKLEHDGYNVLPIFVMGQPATEILDNAKKYRVDMILMGTHGHGHLYNLLLGSVAEEILKKAPCPILMVPMKE